MKKDKDNVKETEPTIVSSSILAPSYRPQDSALVKSASYISNRDEFSDLDPMPSFTDTDALVDWFMTQGSEHFTEEQRASVHRHHSLHFHGVEDCMYCFPSLFTSCDQANWLNTDPAPAVTETPGVDQLPALMILILTMPIWLFLQPNMI
jgi:hypothetical protein